MDRNTGTVDPEATYTLTVDGEELQVTGAQALAFGRGTKAIAVIGSLESMRTTPSGRKGVRPRVKAAGMGSEADDLLVKARCAGTGDFVLGRRLLRRSGELRQTTHVSRIRLPGRRTTSRAGQSAACSRRRRSGASSRTSSADPGPDGADGEGSQPRRLRGARGCPIPDAREGAR